MDMKKILQALDTASSKPVENSSDMKKFVSIVTEGSNPHKVALPVQMAMQHYQETKPVKESTLRKYFVEAEEVINQKQEEKHQLMTMYAQRIAKRVLENRDSYQRDYDSSRTGFGRPPREDDEYVNGDEDEVRAYNQHMARHSDVPHDVHINGKKWKSFGSHSHASNVAKKIKGATVHKSMEEGVFGDIKDAIVGKSAEDWAKTSTQMAALIKMRAQYPNNKELEQRISDLAFRLNQGSGEVMDYDPKTGQQFPKVPQAPKVQESKKKTLRNSNPCWDNYKPVGTKQKNGRTVPNCVPKE
jgi:hypothetical protein